MSVELTQEVVRELLDYNPESGILTWKERPAKYFADGVRGKQGNANNWNARFSRKEAFAVIKADGYKRGSLFWKMYTAHRIIWLYMTGKWPEQIDHINGDRSDNRWENLRNVSHKENSKNQKRGSHNTSGFTGICWHKKAKKWHARIAFQNIGLFDNIEDAIVAREAANIKHGYHPNHGKR